MNGNKLLERGENGRRFERLSASCLCALPSTNALAWRFVLVLEPTSGFRKHLKYVVNLLKRTWIQILGTMNVGILQSRRIDLCLGSKLSEQSLSCFPSRIIDCQEFVELFEILRSR